MRLLLFCSFFLSMTWVQSQQSILPFTGFLCTANGLETKEVTVELDDQTWTSNRLPINAEFKIGLKEPIGFEVRDSMYKPGIEVFIGTKNLDTLGYAANIYGDGFPGYDVWMLRGLNVTLGFGPEVLAGDSLYIKARFFDQIGTASYTVEGMVTIVDSAALPDVTNSTSFVHSYKGYNVGATGPVIGDMRAEVKEDQRQTLDIYWTLENVYALDISMAETEVWYYFTDGRVRKMNRFEHFNYDFSTITGKTNKDVEGKISCYLLGFDPMSIDYIRVRTESKAKGIVVDGILDLKKIR